jgi:hypothetical protein
VQPTRAQPQVLHVVGRLGTVIQDRRQAGNVRVDRVAPRRPRVGYVQHQRQEHRVVELQERPLGRGRTVALVAVGDGAAHGGPLSRAHGDHESLLPAGAAADLSIRGPPSHRDRQELFRQRLRRRYGVVGARLAGGGEVRTALHARQVRHADLSVDSRVRRPLSGAAEEIVRRDRLAGGIPQPTFTGSGSLAW